MKMKPNFLRVKPLNMEVIFSIQEINNKLHSNNWGLIADRKKLLLNTNGKIGIELSIINFIFVQCSALHHAKIAFRPLNGYDAELLKIQGSVVVCLNGKLCFVLGIRTC